MRTTADAPEIRVLVVDDHPAVRQGVRQLLTAGGHAMAGEAETRQEVLDRLRLGGVDLVLLDLSLDGDSGFDLLADLDEHGVPVLIYSMHETPEIVHRALHFGAKGYVTKRDKPRMLLEAVAQVMAGHRFLSPRASSELDEATAPPVLGGLDSGLSDRERQILQLLGQGDTRQEIAAALGIGTRTVETYCVRLIHKLELSDMKALRKQAISLLRVP